MIGGLLRKNIRETWYLTALFSGAMAMAMGLLTYVLPQVEKGLDDIFGEVPFVRALFVALMGTEIGNSITAQMMQAMLWVHPVVLALLWAYEIILCTRFPASEIDRGTIDVLLGLPVSRRAVFWSETVMWFVGGILVLVCGLLSHTLVVRFILTGATRPDLGKSLWVIVNLLAVYGAVGGVAFLVSACSDRRGLAMGIVFALLLVSFLLNFLAQFWEPAKALVFLSVMRYYQPARIFENGPQPAHLMVLAAITAASWLLAGEVVARRDIRTI